MNSDYKYTISSQEDELASYLNRLVFVNTEIQSRAFVGRLIGLSARYVSLEKRDGRVLKIRRKTIQSIVPMEG
jgi:hypothetical protein